MNAGLKSLLWLAIGGALLSMLSFVIWITVNRDATGPVFGRVVYAGPSTITIADREDRTTNILVASGTLIMDQRTAIDPEDIPIGQFVQVRGKRLTKDAIQAHAIWLMQAPRDPAPHAPRP